MILLYINESVALFTQDAAFSMRAAGRPWRQLLGDCFSLACRYPGIMYNIGLCVLTKVYESIVHDLFTTMPHSSRLDRRS